MKLQIIRRQIDRLDSKIVQLLVKRFELTKEAGEVKKTIQKDLQDRGREETLLTNLSDLAENKGLDPTLIIKLYRIIFEHSIAAQQPQGRCLVAYQGQEGAYSTLAAKRFFKSRKSSLHLVGFDTFSQTIQALETGRTDYAILPVENMVTGQIPEPCDLITHAKVQTIGEIILPIEHCLIGLPSTSLRKIKRIISHPQALLQCKKYLDSLKLIRSENYTDTAMAVQKVFKDQDPTLAAIASAEAAQIYELKILKRHISDLPNNYTRFLILTR